VELGNVWANIQMLRLLDISTAPDIHVAIIMISLPDINKH